ncbi:MAG: hypothetical protein HW416_2571 [Chloroflexi bacterium]|nr:hypothetical protein [Chloroflexota bacterium]
MGLRKSPERSSVHPKSAKIIVAPYYEMADLVAVTAWGRMDAMTTFDEERILRFIRANPDRGPEAVP